MCSHLGDIIAHHNVRLASPSPPCGPFASKLGADPPNQHDYADERLIFGAQKDAAAVLAPIVAHRRELVLARHAQSVQQRLRSLHQKTRPLRTCRTAPISDIDWAHHHRLLARFLVAHARRVHLIQVVGSPVSIVRTRHPRWNCDSHDRPRLIASVSCLCSDLR